MSAYTEFQEHIAHINDLCCVINLLTWDARTQMPVGGSETRGLQLGTVTRIAQELFASDRTARLLEGAEAEVASQDPDSYGVRSVRQVREAYEIARRIPIDLVAEIAALKPASQQVWAEAKAANDFAAFAPYLEKMIALSRKLANAIGYIEHPYDALMLRYEPGMTASRLRTIFESLKPGLSPILKRAIEQGEARADFLDRDYPEEGQRAFALEIAQAIGYDPSRGRLDKSAHPFEISFTRNDVRITTRYNRRYMPMALFGVMHETGHALYEQGLDPALSRTALTTDLLDLYAVGGVSYGTHESQSRLWENLVGRSRVFWQRHFSRLRELFPDQLADVDAEAFYRAVNRVRPSPIRTEADEVTYNFHIMLRVEIEMALLDGKLAVKDLPEAWATKLQEYLGITPPDDARGALQDIHWSTGLYGSFPTYTIGNIMSAQFFAAARRDVPSLDGALARGDYAPLRGWLTEHVYRHGRAFSPEELLMRSTGKGLNVESYLAYLNQKYDDLFPLRA
jgi:carboxypeptidase Taq